MKKVFVLAVAVFSVGAFADDVRLILGRIPAPEHAQAVKMQERVEVSVTKDKDRDIAECYWLGRYEGALLDLSTRIAPLDDQYKALSEKLLTVVGYDATRGSAYFSGYCGVGQSRESAQVGKREEIVAKFADVKSILKAVEGKIAQDQTEFKGIHENADRKKKALEKLKVDAENWATKAHAKLNEELKNAGPKLEDLKQDANRQLGKWKMPFKF